MNTTPSDLLHKMSKKIAQLTKVIYHLNSKGEDHDAQIGALAAAYEGEIDEIIADAAKRIEVHRAAAQRAAAREADRSALLETKKAYEREVSTARAQLATARTAADEAIAAARQAADVKARALAVEVGAAKDELAAAMKLFAQTAAGLEERGAQAAAEADAARVLEVETTVREHNAKYSEMLKQRLAAEEAEHTRADEADAAADRSKSAADSAQAEAEAARRAAAAA
ncbi:hypothetical protein T492DRAFT_1149567, partial [Pavlovales sp. CCMP2436]